MARTSPPQDEGSMTVYRARRRCPTCDLVNADNAARCRRCGHSFSSVDRALESERAHAASRTRRVAVVIVGLLLVAGVVAGIYLVKSRSDRLAAYAERSSVVETDLVALRRGAEGDAALVARAFDDAEVRRLLADQTETWDSRAAQCQALADQLDDLVPQTPQQTERELALERDLAALTSAARGMAEAAKRGDPFAARLEAAKLAKPAGDAASDR